MTRRSQVEAGARFQALHARAGGFIMPNAWDAGSAILLAEAGFEAVGTTSAGVAFSLGRQDYGVTDPGLAVSRDEMIGRAGEMARAVPLPLNGDLEAGYGDRPEEVAETVRRAIKAGLAGANIEDKVPLSNRLYEEPLAVERIAAARAAIEAAGAPFVLTARTDHLQIAPGDLAGAIRRANLYREAGADCLFPPGPTELAQVAILAKEIAGPVNIVLGLGGPGPNAYRLLEAGVQRISLGGTFARAMLACFRAWARELKDKGLIGFAAGQLTGGELNAVFARARASLVQ